MDFLTEEQYKTMTKEEINKHDIKVYTERSKEALDALYTMLKAWKFMYEDRGFDISWVLSVTMFMNWDMGPELIEGFSETNVETMDMYDAHMMDIIKTIKETEEETKTMIAKEISTGDIYVTITPKDWTLELLNGTEELCVRLGDVVKRVNFKNNTITETTIEVLKEK